MHNIRKAIAGAAMSGVVLTAGLTGAAYAEPASEPGALASFPRSDDRSIGELAGGGSLRGVLAGGRSLLWHGGGREPGHRDVEPAVR
jgi:hypothetical protein